QSIWSIIFGTIALVFIFYVPLGLIGAKEGLNTYIIAESAFGEKGSSIAAALVITIIPCVGWYGVQVSIAADALSLGLGLSDEVWAPIFMILLGVIFALPAMYGITSMAWLDYLSIPIILFITGFGVVKALGISGLEGIFSYQPEEAY